MNNQLGLSIRESLPIKEYAFVLRRYLFLIIFCFVVVTITAYFYSVKQEKVYQAIATLEYRLGNANDTNIFRLTGFKNNRDYDSELEKLKSRTYGEYVARKLGYLDPKINEKNVKNLVVVGLTADNTVNQGDYKVIFKDEAGNFEVYNPSKEIIGSGGLMQTFSANGLSFSILDCQAKPGDDFIIQIPDPVPWGEMIKQRINVLPHKRSLLFDVIVKHSNPEEAARIANALAEVAVEADKEIESKREKKKVEHIEGALANISEKLNQAQERTTQYEEDTGKISLNADISDKLRRKNELETAKRRRQLELARYKESLASLIESGIGKYEDLELSLSNLPSAHIKNLAKQLGELVLQRKQALKTLTRAHPDVKQLEVRITTHKDEIMKGIGKEINTIIKDIAVIIEKLDELDTILKDLPMDKLEYTRLNREARSLESLWTKLYIQKEEARINMASEMGQFNIVDKALVPKYSISPKIKRNTVVGALVGLFLGIGLAFFLEYLDNTVKSIRDVELKTNLPVYGIIPYVNPKLTKTNGARKIFKTSDEFLPAKGKRFLFSGDENSFVLEAYRSLRTNISFANFENRGQKIFLFTSAGPQEGKSTTVSHLAYITAQTGSRTLLFDCDLRRPVLHTTFEIPKNPGLTNVLSNVENLGDVIYPTRYKNLSVIPSGTIPPNPSELLGSDKMKQLLEAVKPHFDMIFIDTPPTVTFTDSSVLSPWVDGVFIITQPRKTTEEALMHSIHLLKKVKAKLLGIIINKISTSDSYEGYSFNYYNYYYGYYYDGDGKNKRKRKSFKN